MWYKMKKKSELPIIIMGNRMTNKDPLTKAYNKGYNDGFEDGFKAACGRITGLHEKIDGALKTLEDIAREDGINLE